MWWLNFETTLFWFISLLFFLLLLLMFFFFFVFFLPNKFFTHPIFVGSCFLEVQTLYHPSPNIYYSLTPPPFPWNLSRKWYSNLFSAKLSDHRVDFFKLLYRTLLQSFNIHISFLHHPSNVYNSKTACLENGKWRTALFSFTLIHFTPFFMSRFCVNLSLSVAG